MTKALYKKITPVSKSAFLFQDVRRKGIAGFVIAHIQKSIFDPISKLIFDQTIAKKQIRIDGKSYQYLSHWYNFTWKNERALEIPYFQNLCKQYTPGKTLEIGHTLGHYFPHSHQVIDKYEKADSVINIDVLEFTPPKKFDLIIAISTLEHVGWHEAEHDAQKALRAITHLQSLLSPRGRLVFSVPIGVNPALDSAVLSNTLPLSVVIYLRRINRWNVWKECKIQDIQNARYDFPYPNANAIVIGEIQNRKIHD
jgi:hypothetical protein